MNYNTIIPDKHKFLQGLKDIAKVPERLYIRGTLPDNRISAVAIVGTRKPTSYGKEVTYTLAYDLAQRGIVIVSGLAFGVDAIAHRAALDAGGITIAILGNGIDSIYPRTNEKLGKEILTKGGALVSEYPPGATTYKDNFLARNRLISGLSDAVVVTEAAARSGSLSTVNHALDQGKDVYAVPGNITSPMSAGCNEIIRQGAMPLLHTQEILNCLHIENTPPQSSEEQVLLQLLKQKKCSTDQLITYSQLPSHTVLRTLTLLEIGGTIQLVNHRWSLI